MFQLLEVKIAFLVENPNVLSDNDITELLGEIEAIYRDLKKQIEEKFLKDYLKTHNDSFADRFDVIAFFIAK